MHSHTQKYFSQINNATLTLTAVSLCLSVCTLFFSTRPSDRNQIWHTYSDRYGTGSHLKKLTNPTPVVRERTRANTNVCGEFNDSSQKEDTTSAAGKSECLCEQPGLFTQVKSHVQVITSASAAAVMHSG